MTPRPNVACRINAAAWRGGSKTDENNGGECGGRTGAKRICRMPPAPTCCRKYYQLLTRFRSAEHAGKATGRRVEREKQSGYQSGILRLRYTAGGLAFSICYEMRETFCSHRLSCNINFKQMGHVRVIYRKITLL